MITITEEIIEAAAPNAEAAKNGRGLVLKNKFLALHHDDDKTILFGSAREAAKARTAVRRLRRARQADVPLHLPQPAVSLQALPWA